MKRRFPHVACLAVLAAWFFPAPGLAADGDYGPVGLTSLETARLAAFCPAEPARTGLPDPCDINFHFRDLSGRILKESNLMLQPGTGGFLDLRLSDIGSTASRVEIVPCIKVRRGGPFSSVQILDNFALRTRILTSWGSDSIAASGEMHVAAAGITALDTARLTVFCPAAVSGGSPIEPCRVTLLFHEIGGRTVKQTVMTLQPGTGGSLDLRSSEVGSAARRVEIVPCVKVGAGAAVVTFQVIDNWTGLTTALAYPGAPIRTDTAQ